MVVPDTTGGIIEIHNLNQAFALIRRAYCYPRFLCSLGGSPLGLPSFFVDGKNE